MKTIKIFITLSSIIIICWLFYLLVIPTVFSKKDVMVPEITNINVDEGISKLEKLKIKYNIIYVPSDNNEDIIIKTYPLENTLVKRKSNVTLYVLKEKDIVYPDYEGLIYEEQKDNINDFCKANNIKLKIEYKVNNDYPEGLIQKQDKKPYTNLLDDYLTLEIIKHNNLIKMPSVVGKELNEAILLLSKANLKYKVIYETSFLPFNTVIEQNYQQDSLILKGNQSPIILYVSKGLRF